MEVTVQKEGGDFCTIQEAVEAVPYEESAVIRIGEGVYNEKVFCEKKDVTLIGAGIDKTILKFDDYANEIMEDGQKRGTFRSYTAFFGGRRVVVRNMTIKNTAGDGRVVGQALAVYADADVCFFENVKMTGCQDTLFCAPLPRTARQKNGFLGPRLLTERRLTRQYYKNCEITGDIDFIFGGADAVFDDCIITCNDRMHVRSTDDAAAGGSATAGEKSGGKASSATSAVAVSDSAAASGVAPAVTAAFGVAPAVTAASGVAPAVASASGVAPAVASASDVAPAVTAASGAVPVAASAPILDKDQIDVKERPVNGYITAACGLKDDIGFIFRNCVIKGAPGCEEGSVFLGRPWRDEAKTVFLNCVMDSTIAPERFSGWGGITKNQPDTFYGEFGTKLLGECHDGYEAESLLRSSTSKSAEGNNQNAEKGDGHACESLSGTAIADSASDKHEEAKTAALPEADLTGKNPWVRDIDAALASELSKKADTITEVCIP